MRRIVATALVTMTLAAVGTPPAAAATGPTTTGPTATGPTATGRGAVVVRTDAGFVEGSIGDGVRTFQGMPYAAPPEHDLRWHPPQPVTPWQGVLPATEPGPDCAQNSLGPSGVQSGSEDCLYLNVTAPLDRRGRHPVVVWLHGGSFQNGSGRQYDAHRLAADGDTVVVTVNYRLGVFGYFGLDGLPGSGTFGLQDQQAALRWVRRNAAAFGGDPHNVTLAGQSAGALSICAQLTSPSATALFDKAILQSGPCLMSWPDELFYPGLPAASQFEPVGKVRRAGAELAGRQDFCGDAPDILACMRRQDRDKLLMATRGAGLEAFTAPAYGTGLLLPVHPATAVRAGAFHRVPVMSGGNLDEHRGFIVFLPVTADDYPATLRKAFHDRAGDVAAQYPVDAYESPALAWAAVATDRIWACPTLAGDRLLARHTPVYGYEFAERNGPSPGGGLPWGASHGFELPYLFDTGFPPGTPQPSLAREMIGAWARFAATGRPDPGSWPRFRADAAVPFVRTLAVEAHDAGGVDLGTEHRCAFWATMTPDPRGDT